ncbi:hypothetical protein Nepgr_007422 [Nepenthes gracilis]|uniref:Disease resistance protein RGA3 n=1 Tax=Nepenthes gracilis TaxID=150966 RepID=A0AAD3S7R7_NEPGR|nr:hypothetical protein Nepgr_007422 [Nepenthes gracilis]
MLLYKLSILCMLFSNFIFPTISPLPTSLAMAEATIFTLLKAALKTLASPAVREVGLSLGAIDELQQLSNTLPEIEVVLQDARTRQFIDDSVRKWLETLKDVFYDLDDILDELATEALVQKNNHKGNMLKKVSKSFSALAFHSDLSQKMGKICGKLNEIAAQGREFQLNESSVETCTSRTRPGEPVTFVRPSNFVGRENDKEEMIKRVLSCRDHETLSVIPVVGVGGIGKTLFARMLTFDERLHNNFEIISWGCLSSKSDLRMILEDIIKSAKGVSSWNLTMEELCRELHELLRGKKYFLVLDDVWTEHPGEWKRLRDLLDVGAKGSTIIVTTRVSKVASVVATEKAHVLNRLSDEDCWSVFVNYAFDEGEHSKHPSLVEIGRSIVKKCGGIPLAAEIVGSLLTRERDEQEWQRIKEKLVKAEERLDNAAVAAIKLSYDEMPPQLKACFAYFSIFPNDYTIYKEELMNIWLAQGLLGDQDAEFEDTGATYFGEMLSRSLFRYAFLTVGGTGNCKMHDMVRDFVPYMVGDEFATNINCASVLASDKVKHIGFHDYNLFMKEFPKELAKAKKARTFMFLDQVGPITKSFLENLISNFKCLRVLNLMGSEFVELPRSIGKLKHLRYLSLFSNCNIKSLPDSLCKLVNLQTLDLRHCEQLKELPREIGRLINLRRLFLTSQMVILPEESLKSLTSLQVLKLIDCENLLSLSSGIGYLTALRELHIVRCPRLASLPSSLRSLAALRVLEVVDCERMDLFGVECMRGLTSLAVLDIVKLPKLVGLTPNLLAAASSLRHLMIVDCGALTELPEWVQHFSSLEKLYLYNCANLTSLPEGFRCLSNLKLLDIRGCTHLSRRCEKDKGDDWPRISHVPVIILDGNWIQRHESP